MVQITLIGWIFIGTALFVCLPGRRALLFGMVGAWLLLPQARISWPLSALFPLDKLHLTPFVLLGAAIAFDMRSIIAFRPRWSDLAILLLCFLPMLSSQINGTGIGAASSMTYLAMFGVPYLLGRVYFQSTSHLNELALALFLGGLIYVPLCLYEIRMSPQLHVMLYGFHQHNFTQSYQFGGYRPVVFMQHGLAVGMWMTAASLAGLWLWRSRAVRDFWGVPIGPLVIVLLVTTVLCKSTGALVLLAVGIGIWLLRRQVPLRWMLLGLVICIPLYMGMRITGLANTATVCNAVGYIVPDQKIGSLEARLEQEDVLLDRAIQKPLIGWGPFGARAAMDGQPAIGVLDSMWLNVFGRYGMLGLASLVGLLLGPTILLVRRCRDATWHQPAFAGTAALAMILPLYMIDNLFNAMPNPILMMAAGAAASLATQPMIAVAPAARPATRRRHASAPTEPALNPHS